MFTSALKTFFGSGVVATVTDAFFNLVTLLLPGNGTNGAQNNTFLDSSTNNFSITRNGNTTQGTFSPFSQTGWSNYFDGSGDFLSWNSGSSVAFGTSDFTVEAFVYVTSTPNTKYIIDARDSSNTGAWAFAFGLGGTGYKLGFFDGTTTIEEATASIPNNSWQHCVAVRSGTTLSVYLNGGRVATATNSKNLNVSPTTSYVGTRYTGSGYDIEGYISNVRIIKGTAAYDPTQTTITVPTAQLTDVTNTVLLTCASNSFFDKNTQATAKTITAAGTPSIQAFSPFAPTAAYSAATVGGSGYFDGTGDFLNSSHPALNATFTIEAWVYRTSGSALQSIVFLNSGGVSGVIVYIDASNFLVVTDGVTGQSAFSNLTVPINAWAHVAVVRSGGTTTGYVNGVVAGSHSFTPGAVNAATIARYTAASPLFFPGYISNVRVVNGTAVYTGAFTPPTAPLTAITDTSLLLNFTNAGITDATAKNDLETVGNASISTTQSQFGGSSISFDGTGDGLILPASPFYNFLDGNFTVEAWVYIAGNSPLDGLSRRIANIFSVSTSSAFSFNFIIRGDGTTTGTGLEIYNGTNIVNVTGTISQSTWHHIAVTKSGTSVYFFLNGTQMGTTQTTSGNWGSATVAAQVGRAAVTSYTFDLNGYIDDLRVTRFARYTANCTAPTSAFALQ